MSRHAMHNRLLFGAGLFLASALTIIGYLFFMSHRAVSSGEVDLALGTAADVARAEEFYAGLNRWSSTLSEEEYHHEMFQHYLDSGSSALALRFSPATRQSAEHLVALAISGRLGYDTTWVDNLPPFFTVIQLAKFNLLSAAIDIADSRVESGAIKIIQTGTLGRRLQEDGPGLIGMLVGIAIEDLAINVLGVELNGILDCAAEPTHESIDDWLSQSSLRPPDMTVFLNQEAGLFRKALDQYSTSAGVMADDAIYGETRPLSSVEMFERHFLFDPRETVKVVEERYSQILDEDGKSYFSHQHLSCRPISDTCFSRINRFGPNLVRGIHKLAGNLNTRATLAARARVTLLGFRAGQRTRRSEHIISLTDLTTGIDSSILANPTSGTSWLLNPDRHEVSGIIVRNGCGSPYPLEDHPVSIRFVSSSQ